MMNATINQEKLNGTLRFLEKQGEMTLEQLRESDPAAAALLEKLAALFKNEEFDRQLMACPDNQAVVKLFGENGFEMTEEEAGAIIAYIKGLVQKLKDGNGELGEEELEMIAGGWSGWGNFFIAIGGTAAGCALVLGLPLGGVGAAIGAAIGAVAGIFIGIFC